MLYSLQFLKSQLSAIIIKVSYHSNQIEYSSISLQGIPTIERVVYTKAKDKGNYLVVEVLIFVTASYELILYS
jgi:hypothetical protein